MTEIVLNEVPFRKLSGGNVIKQSYESLAEDVEELKSCNSNKKENKIVGNEL